MSDVEKPAGTPSILVLMWVDESDHTTGNVSESENKDEIRGDPMDIEAGHTTQVGVVDLI